MKKRAWTDPLVLVLSAVAVAQVAWFLSGSLTSSPEPNRLAVGDNLSEARIVLDGGPAGPSSFEGARVVLVFHSECAYCEQAAPEWADWLRDQGAGIAVIAVSSEPREAAAAYARRHGWEVKVAGVVDAERGSVAHALTSRTPWVFVLDASGRIVAGGHGQQLAELTAPWLTAATSSGDGQD